MNNINISNFVFEKAKQRGKHHILYYRNNELAQWVGITWNEFSEKTRSIARALVALDVKEEDRIGICTQNMPQCLIVDFAIYANRAISVPMFATLSSSQIAYILNDAQIEILFVGEQKQFDNAVEAMKESPSLKKIVAFDNSVDFRGCGCASYFSDLLLLGENNSDNDKIIKQRQKKSSEDDLVNIIYTSGTTGDSKGVMITSGSIAETMRIHKLRIPMYKRGKSIAFLPLSHIFERLWTYLCLSTGVKIYFNSQPAEIQRIVAEIRPHYMCSVPRFWEKVSIGVNQKIDEMKPFMQALVAWAIAVGKDYNINHKRIGKKISLSLWLRYKIANAFIFNKLKKTLGIENGVMFPTAGATMTEKQIIFFRSLGIPIYYGYGLTETNATVCCFPDQNWTIGSIGTLMPDVKAKIGEDNEILVKGKIITKGYYNRPKETAEAFIDGWFRTGDCGKLEGDTLTMTDRLKDLFKTSNGKYISPQAIETALTSDRYIEQVAVIGNNRNYVTAIIAPAIEPLKEFAAKNDLQYEHIEDLFKYNAVQQLFEERIEKAQNNFATFEKIKKFRLIRRSFSIESGELTSTLKLRRAVIQQNYASLIKEMYE
ncbi:MAG: long-chain fatty acid--CoA ligase [Prevotellaceae bacterium]|jgi:long-chain acyl-CoA synthetase|nr:long-chain fatty acid--CoA ligase [Prevotellaceae bacterium]